VKPVLRNGSHHCTVSQGVEQGGVSCRCAFFIWFARVYLYLQYRRR